jgi:hypothetical protein
MNNRSIFRAYAQSKGKEAVEFVRTEDDALYTSLTLVTRNKKGEEERTLINFREMLFWALSTYHLEKK